jgi:hypothetical protein
MRAIINMASARGAAATGWRAREIRVEKTAATLEDVLKATDLKGGNATLYDLVADENGLKSDFSLFISGEFLQGCVDLKRTIQDSEQIHLWDWPFSNRDS